MARPDFVISPKSGGAARNGVGDEKGATHPAIGYGLSGRTPAYGL